jgi:Holliday junction DNA helicase RuvA
MISFLSGKILNKGQGYVILRVGDIGYKVFVGPIKYAELGCADAVEFYIYENVREDADDLYGFGKLEELEMFELLLTINGVGPKSAHNILSIVNLEDLREAIGSGDASALTKVSGVGKKTAERLVLELRDKVAYLATNQESGNMQKSDEIDALMALGYSLSQAREALQGVDPSIKDSGERIKRALKNI